MVEKGDVFAAGERDAVDVELSLHEVRRDGIGVLRGGRHDAPRLPGPRHHAVRPHQPRHALGARRQAGRAQLAHDARRAERLSALGERDPDERHQHLVHPACTELRGDAIVGDLLCDHSASYQAVSAAVLAGRR